MLYQMHHAYYELWEVQTLLDGTVQSRGYIRADLYGRNCAVACVWLRAGVRYAQMVRVCDPARVAIVVGLGVATRHATRWSEGAVWVPARGWVRCPAFDRFPVANAAALRLPRIWRGQRG